MLRPVVGLLGIASSLVLWGCLSSPEEEMADGGVDFLADGGSDDASPIPPFLNPKDLQAESERLLAEARARFQDPLEIQVEAVVGERTGSNRLLLHPVSYAPNPLFGQVYIGAVGMTEEPSSPSPYLFFGFYTPESASLAFLILGTQELLTIPVRDDALGEEFTISEQVRFLGLQFASGVPPVAIHCNESTNPPCRPPLDSMKWIFPATASEP